VNFETITEIDRVGNPFLDTLGARLDAWRPGYAEFSLVIESRHLNRQGTLQGGVISTLLDVACGYAGLYAAEGETDRHASTLALSLNFISKAAGGVVRARGLYKGGGARIFFAQGELVSDTGELIAMASGTFKYSSRIDRTAAA
jgi:uncharacterized protein (TIGR00369 family)